MPNPILSRQTTYTRTTVRGPDGRRQIREEEESVIRTRRRPPRSPSPLFLPPRILSRSPSPSPRPILQDTRFPHTFYEENPARRRSYERDRSAAGRHPRSPSTVRFVPDDEQFGLLQLRFPSPPPRGLFGEQPGFRSGHSPPPLRLPGPTCRRSRVNHSRNRSRSRSRNRRRAARSRSKSRDTSTSFIQGALVAAGTALAIREVRRKLGEQRARTRDSETQDRPQLHKDCRGHDSSGCTRSYHDVTSPHSSGYLLANLARVHTVVPPSPNSSGCPTDLLRLRLSSQPTPSPDLLLKTFFLAH
ncbi:uncharacterized protein Z519_11648 [Cladophialophora bantiana CBS 173.52]|uniref:Uncharacterized protein n=1 Tax=Cladophialophora bantiana (strain ATCC 10958 / CBS 173.52 / CDC B-1940 / NIH 8579) TaxID=1442370 RepID=A0A0D2HTA5_CLAB1|nr:uncharacterized protein Z519_11648 [Cladophialophora bantiana CBS 173.52]KIW87674.1 hypothetical protein Z519_11648 [Cladophialophora bantiana CBS 173.52]